MGAPVWSWDGIATPTVILYLPSVFCDALYRKGLSWKYLRELRNIIFTAGHAHLPPKPGVSNSDNSGSCL